MEALGFTIPALQAILYGKPELDLFEEGEKRDPLLSHLHVVVQLASDLGARALVFGSPSHRSIAPRDPAAAGCRARETLSEVGKICAAKDVTFCIEPIPAAYGGEYLPRWRDVAEVVDELDTPGIGLHFDTACVALGGDDPVSAIGECAHLIRHFHVSEPHLAGFESPSLPHAEIGRALREQGYDGWVSIEMRAAENVHSAIERAVTMVRKWYVS